MFGFITKNHSLLFGSITFILDLMFGFVTIWRIFAQ